MQELQKVEEIVQQLNIIDDTLFQKMAEDVEFCEEMISTILQQNVIVKEKRMMMTIKAGKTIYHIDRVVHETGEVQDNGLQEIYVNTKINDGTDIAELMRIFTEQDAYDFEKFPKVSKRKKQFKESEGGKKQVCDLVENYARQCVEKAAKEAEEKAAKEAENSALKLFKNGVSYEVVRASITSLSDEKLQKIYQETVFNEADELAEETSVRYTHEEVFDNIRKRVNK